MARELVYRQFPYLLLTWAGWKEWQERRQAGLLALLRLRQRRPTVVQITILLSQSSRLILRHQQVVATTSSPDLRGRTRHELAIAMAKRKIRRESTSWTLRQDNNRALGSQTQLTTMWRSPMM